MQNLMNTFSKAHNTFSLKVSKSKTVPMCREQEIQPKITLQEDRLKTVDKFCYLGSTINRGLELSKEISDGISKAAATYGKLQNS